MAGAQILSFAAHKNTLKCGVLAGIRGIIPGCQVMVAKCLEEILLNWTKSTKILAILIQNPNLTLETELRMRKPTEYSGLGGSSDQLIAAAGNGRRRRRTSAVMEGRSEERRVGKEC